MLGSKAKCFWILVFLIDIYVMYLLLILFAAWVLVRNNLILFYNILESVWVLNCFAIVPSCQKQMIYKNKGGGGGGGGGALITLITQSCKNRNKNYYTEKCQVNDYTCANTYLLSYINLYNIPKQGMASFLINSCVIIKPQHMLTLSKPLKL